MMRTEIRTILRDIQAAARIGHTESLWAALNGLLDLPMVSGNQTMDETTLNQVVLPIAGAIAKSRLNHAALRPLASHSFAVFRAIAGAAMVEQYIRGSNGTRLADLKTLAQDPRQDVRDAIRLAVVMTGAEAPEQLEQLYEAWVTSPSPRTRTLAYQILPELPGKIILEKIENLNNGTLTHQPEVKKSLAKSLSILGAGGHAPQVLAILSTWARQPEADYRLICRCLSDSWASSHAEESLTILAQLAAQNGPRKRTRKALESLYQRGAKQEVRAALQQWRESDNPNLKAAGDDPKLKL